MKTKFFLGVLSTLTISSTAFAESAKMRVGTFEGQIFTKENVRIESLKLESGFNFCWGICGGGVGSNSLTTKAKTIKSRIQSSPNQKAVNFQSLETVSLRGGSLLGNFQYCAVQLTVTGTDDRGQQFSTRAAIGKSAAKDECARGGATPQLTDHLELKSYMSNSGDRVYYVAQ